MSEGGDWVFVKFDEKLAKKRGMPAEVPIPKAAVESLTEGLSVDRARGFVATFVGTARGTTWARDNAAQLSRYEAFLGKADLWTKAQGAFATRDFKKAASTLRMLCNLDKDDHAARMNLAAALASSGENEKALESLDLIRDTYAGDAEYHVMRGQVLLAIGRREDAAEEMASALEADPGHRQALDTLVQLGVLVKVYEDPRDAQSLTFLRVDSLVKALADIWAEAPRDAAYFLEQLVYHQSEGRFDVALAAADRAVETAGDGAHAEAATLRRAAILRALARAEDALAAADAAVAKWGSAWAHTERASALLALKRGEEATAAVDAALAKDPGDAAALVLRFWPSEAHDVAAVARALPALEAFVAAHADVAGAVRSLARAHIVIGRDDEAREGFARALTLAPSDDDLRAEYWAELGRQRRFADVLTDAATVTDVAKRDWKLRWSEAEAYAGLQKTVEARGAFTALNLDASLPVEVRRRAKRAVQQMGGG